MYAWDFSTPHPSAPSDLLERDQMSGSCCWNLFPSVVCVSMQADVRAASVGNKGHAHTCLFLNEL